MFYIINHIEQLKFKIKKKHLKIHIKASHSMAFIPNIDVKIIQLSEIVSHF